MIHILCLANVLVRSIQRITTVLFVLLYKLYFKLLRRNLSSTGNQFFFQIPYGLPTTMTYYKCKLMSEYLIYESNFECISYPKYHMYQNIHIRTVIEYTEKVFQILAMDQKHQKQFTTYLIASIMASPIFTQFEACCGLETGRPETQQQQSPSILIRMHWFS